MSGLRLGLLFVLVLAAALVAIFPLGLALRLAPSGLSAASVQGSIWSGRVEGARLGPLALGNARVGLDPVALAGGGLRARIDADGLGEGRFTLVRSRSEIGLLGAEASLPASLLNLPWANGGSLTLEKVDALFRDGRCRAARGRIVTDLLQHTAAGAAWRGPVLTGEAACRDGVLVVPLSGRSPEGAVEAVLRISGDGRYRLETRVAATDPRLAGALGLAGFAPGADGARRVDEGRLG